MRATYASNQPTTNSRVGPSYVRALSVVSVTRSTQTCMTASRSASRVGKWRYRVPGPTPARLAMSSSDAS